MRGFTIVSLALILLMAACGKSAPAGPWVVFYTRGEVTASVDTSRMSRAAPGHELWLRFDAAPSQVPGDPGKTYTRTEILQRVDCAGDSVNSYRMTMRDATGNVVDEVTRESGWRTMSANPLWRTGIYPALCEWLARRDTR